MTRKLPGDAAKPIVVDLYARLSRNPDGHLEKIETQLADCGAVAIRRGWTVGQRWDDPNMSAWKRGRKRKGWDALLERIKSGEIDGVVCWHTDRLFRQPADLEQLITLAEANGLMLASAYGEHDLDNSDDRAMLRVGAAMACKSSDDTSRRLRRRFATMREEGKVNGGARPFGFPGGDRTTPKDADGNRPAAAAALVERERAALRAAAADIIAGLPIRRIVDAWNDEGLTSSTGATWTQVLVRAVMLRPRNAGLIEHDGAVVGRMSGEPILDEDTFAAVRAVFAARRRGAAPGERYLASGVLRCGTCGKPLSGRPHAGHHPDGSKRRQYHCQRDRGGCGGVAADVRLVDGFLRSWVLRRLGDPANVAQLAARAAQTAQRAAELNEEISRAQTLREQLGDRLGRGEIDLGTFDAAVQPLSARLARLHAERDELAAAQAQEPGDLPDPEGGEVADQWDDAGDVAEQRAMLLTALSGMRARLLPSGGNRRAPIEDRIDIEPIRSAE